MFMRFFRALMPKEERFVERFVAHSGFIVAAADSLTAMMAADGAGRQARCDEILNIESQADVVARQTVFALHRAFITPFDRSDILALSKSLDDAVDLIEEVVLGVDLYRVTEFDAHMRGMAAMIQGAARQVAELMPLLNDITGNAERIRGMCETISKIEGQADTALRDAVSELVAARPDTVTFFGRKEVYELLEAVTDSCDDVADLVEGIVLDHV